ncbi:MAG: Holliday junction resolvase RuvX [Bacteroidota bacterium]
MPRILAIDYGKKRTGIAVTDPLQLIATALDTVDTQELFAFLKAYCKREAVEQFVIGDPRNLDDSDTHATPLVRQCIARLQKEFPDIPVVAVDERFSSKRARQAMLDMGMKKKERQKKANVDQIAAALLLQEYLESRGNNNIPIN